MLALSPAEEQPDAPLQGVELLRAVREMETTVTLLSTIRAQSEGREEAPALVAKYKAVIMDEELTLLQMRTLQYEALGELLDVDYDIVSSRGVSVRKATNPNPNPNTDPNPNPNPNPNPDPNPNPNPNQVRKA